MGANGAGKTTLFRLLLGLSRPDAGTVEVCGIPVADDPIGVRRRIGYMPEHDCLPLDQTAADVVATFGELGGLPVRAARQRASEVLDLVGLDEARFRPVGGFSTGMRQRTKLAQAIVADPELVLLDEPTAGLDPSGREEMLALVARLGSFGIAVVLATHLLDDVARVCDHVVMLDAGRLVTDAPTETLLHQTGTVTVDVGPAGRAAAGRGPGRPGPGRHRPTTWRHDGGDRRRRRPTSTPSGTWWPTSACPLHRLTNRLTSLDDVFVHRAPADRRGGAVTAPATGGAVYDRGYRPYDGAAGRAAGVDGRPLPDVAAAGHRAAPAVAAEGGARRPAGHRRRPGGGQRRRRLPHPRHAGRGLRVHHLPGVRRRLAAPCCSSWPWCAPDIVCPDRRQRVLPLIFARPLTGPDYVLAKVGAIFTCVFAFSFLPQVVLYVGQMLVSDGALDYLRHNTAVLWQVPVAVAVLALFYAVLGRGRGVADRPADGGRGDAAGHHPGVLDRLGHPRRGQPAHRLEPGTEPSEGTRRR